MQLVGFKIAIDQDRFRVSAFDLSKAEKRAGGKSEPVYTLTPEEIKLLQKRSATQEN
jgi:hypothetical protein